jgi:16S rRNA (cytosine967-C5)-methyltransferase
MTENKSIHPPLLRLIAARVIDEVTQGQSLTDSLEHALRPIKDPRDRAFIQAICFGVCRFYTRLDVILSHLLQKPMQAKDADVHALLLVGLYQIIEMRVPAHAAVSETVNATEKLNKPWARGLVNAILREYLRHSEDINAAIQSDEEAFYAHPAWWVDTIKEAWPTEWEAILNANNSHPPFSLRVNQQHLSREKYLALLAENSISAQIIPDTTNGIILDTPISVEQLPGFAAGDVSVQDGAAQLAAELLQLAPQQHVLDACAAPGGKLTHMLEVEPTLSLVAVEKEAGRLSPIKENLLRLNMQATVICCDAGDAKDWWDGQPFDRILLDAPCSASGIIRRHPDIKLLREPGDVSVLAKEQRYLLDALWPCLKPGGLLIYATCSIFPEENSQVVQRFLAAHPDAQEEKIEAAWGVPCDVGRQIFPGKHMDGFYYARLKKIAS